MKNSRQYAEKVCTLYSALKRKYGKVKKPVYEEPLDALVYAIVSENVTDSQARSIMKRFANHFVDWNDLRVSRQEEILEVLGRNAPEKEDIAAALGEALYWAFNKYNVVSLEPLTEVGKRSARGALEKIDSLSRFAANYVMLTALRGHAIPLTNRMIEYLRNNDLVHPEADEWEIEGFLERQVSAAKAYEFYALLRRESEKDKTRARGKTIRGAKAGSGRAKKASGRRGAKK